MQSHVLSLSERIDRLERQNRRLRWLLLGLPVVALLIGAQAQQAVWKGKTVVAEEFVLSDPNGKMRATLMRPAGGVERRFGHPTGWQYGQGSR